MPGAEGLRQESAGPELKSHPQGSEHPACGAVGLWFFRDFLRFC